MSGGRRSGWDLVLCAAALAVAYAVKAFGSGASAGELAVLLAPTSWGVELLSGREFFEETGAGYVNLELGIAIAPACAGLNFLVISFVTLVFGFVRRCPSVPGKAAWFGASAVLAFAVTVFVNTLRIVLSLAVRAAGPWEWLSPHAAHRALGVGVYLVCLLGLYALVGRAFRGRAAALGYALPFGFYLGVTLVVPLLRGASARTEFLPHAGVVLAFAAAAALALRLQKSRRPAASSAPSQTAPSPS